MRPLRLAYLWLAGGIVMTVFVLYWTLAPQPSGAALVNDKLAHFLAFSTLMLWFSGVFRRGRFPLVALSLAGMGIGIELLQGQLTYRSAEFADALADFGGIGLAWLLALAGLGRWAELVESRVLR